MNAPTTEPSLTRLCARRLHQIATNPVSQPLKDKVILAILDYLGAIACGLQAPWAQAIIDYARHGKDKTQEAFTWGLNAKTSAETSAFVNAVLAHSAIRDDMHLPSNAHIGSMVISAALALAQRDGWSDERLIKAIVGGYEMSALLGTAFQQTEGYNRHFRPSGMAGAFGAAAAAVVASNHVIDEDKATSALAFAANMSSGFNQWAWSGGVEIYTEMGTASASGITAFDIAKSGMECSEDVLEGKAGYFAALGIRERGKSRFLEWLNTREIGSGLDEVRFKPVAGCNYAQTPIAAALRASKRFQELKSKSGGPSIQEVVVRTTSAAKDYPGCDNPGPFSTVQQTKMSIYFGVCASLVHGHVSEELFKRFDDEEIMNLVSKCSVDSLNEFSEAIKEGRQPARVEVKFSDGSTTREQLDDVPWLNAETVHQRFHKELKPILSDDEQSKVVDILSSLDKADSCRALINIFERN